jgi:SAM-dependent methyltransferase
MKDALRANADALGLRVANDRVLPAAFRAALEHVPADDRDAWLDRVFELDALPLPEDGPALLRGCVPYLPSSVEVLLRAVDQASIGADDVFVDIGSGLGRAAALVHLVTGAAAIGVEIQPALAHAARALATRLNLSRLSFVDGDAASHAAAWVTGTVFFLYCPFSGERLERVLADLEPVARARPIRVCCVDLPLPTRSWLTLASSPSGDLTIYRSVHLAME